MTVSPMAIPIPSHSQHADPLAQVAPAGWHRAAVAARVGRWIRRRRTRVPSNQDQITPPREHAPATVLVRGLKCCQARGLLLVLLPALNPTLLVLASRGPDGGRAALSRRGTPPSPPGTRHPPTRSPPLSDRTLASRRAATPWPRVTSRARRWGARSRIGTKSGVTG